MTVNERARCPQRAQLFAEELDKIFNKANNNDNRRACQSDEKQDGEELHAEVRESVHIRYFTSAATLCNVIVSI